MFKKAAWENTREIHGEWILGRVGEETSEGHGTLEGVRHGSSAVKKLMGSHPLPTPTACFLMATQAARHILVWLLAQNSRGP